MRRLKPLVDRDVAALKDRPDLAGELLLAVSTTSKSDPTAFNGGYTANASTMRANWPFRPDNRFQSGDGGGLIMKVRF